MKHLILLLGLMSMPLLATAQTGEFVTCKVVEKKGKVKIEFGQDVTYLGTNYVKDILYFDNKKVKFGNGEEAIACLSASHGWILTGTPVRLEDDAIMWVLKHELNRHAVNSTRNVRALGREGRRYYNEEDDIYFGFHRSRGR